MRIKLLLLFGFVLSTFIVVMSISSTVTTVRAQLQITPAPTPTPGIEARPLPYTTEGGNPILSKEAALQHVLLLEPHWATRATPLTEDVLAANPDLVTVEQYSTRQEAANVYKQGTFVDSSVASEPVWVVRIKGKVSVNFPGTRGEQAAQSVIYVISQKTGHLLEIDAMP